MKKLALTICAILLLICSTSNFAQAQGINRGPDITTIRDVELERESMHNLEVARHYFRLKKAYRAALQRCEEVIAGNPNFARMDEVLYIAGASNLRLAENRGKQTASLPADKLRSEARHLLSRLAEEFPESEFRTKAESELRLIGDIKPIKAKADTPNSKPDQP